MYIKRQRTAALIICVAIMFVMLFSATFIVKEANHDCEGSHCSICACIQNAEQALRQLGHGVTGTTTIFVALILLLCLYCAVSMERPSSNTLVNQKVRLND